MGTEIGTTPGIILPGYLYWIMENVKFTALFKLLPVIVMGR